MQVESIGSDDHPSNLGRNQYHDIDAMRAVTANPELLYRIIKIFDAYPAEGTWPIHAQRAQTFFGSNIRQFFYEPLGSYNAVLDAAMLAAAERRRFVPDELIDHVSIT